MEHRVSESPLPNRGSQLHDSSSVVEPHRRSEAERFLGTVLCNATTSNVKLFHDDGGHGTSARHNWRRQRVVLMTMRPE